MKNQMTIEKFNQISNEAYQDFLEDTEPVPMTNEAWIKILNRRIARQKRDLAALLDRADDDYKLMPFCIELRNLIQETKRRLADCRSLRGRMN